AAGTGSYLHRNQLPPDSVPFACATWPRASLPTSPSYPTSSACLRELAVTAQQQSSRISAVPLTVIKRSPGQPTLPKTGNRGTAMTDNTELQRLMRLRRLGRQIAASLPTDFDREQACERHGYVGELLERRPHCPPRP